MLLSVQDLTVTYRTRRGSNVVVDGISFEISERQLVGLVGESGSGKSSTIHAIARLTDPATTIVQGHVELGGSELMSLTHRELRSIRGTKLGFVGQNPFGFLHPTLRLRRQFHDVLRAHQRTTSQEESFQLASAALESVGIQTPERVLNGYAHQLSGGMAQRVVIAMATVLRPALLIADEPTTALDPTVQIQILDLLARLRDEQGMSVLIVTHDLGIVANYCDTAMVMQRGSIVESGTAAKLINAPEHPYTKFLFADDTVLTETA